MIDGDKAKDKFALPPSIPACLYAWYGLVNLFDDNSEDNFSFTHQLLELIF